jgi:hypothetical protein
MRWNMATKSEPTKVLSKEHVTTLAYRLEAPSPGLQASGQGNMVRGNFPPLRA